MQSKNTAIHTVKSQKDFNLMLIGQVISILGSALLRFALSLYILDLTGRADIYATLYSISNIPLLLSPIGGAVADRFNRRNLMVIFDFTSSTVIFLYYFGLLHGDMSILLTGAVMVILSVISSVYEPAVNASIPLLVEESRLEAANGLVNGVQALSGVAAPVIGGILYGVFGVRLLVLASGAAFFCSALLELFIHIPYSKRDYTGNILSALTTDMKTGFHYVLSKPLIRKAMILAAVLNLILTPFFVIGGPVIFKVAMNCSDSLYGIGMGAVNFATILGALTIGMIAKKMRMNTLYRWLLSISALMVPIAVSITPAWSGLGFYPSYLLFLFGAIPVAMIMTVISIFVITRVQRETPNENLGKVMAIITAVSQCAAPVGQLLYGVIFQVSRSCIYLPALSLCVVMFLIAAVSRKIFINE